MKRTAGVSIVSLVLLTFCATLSNAENNIAKKQVNATAEHAHQFAVAASDGSSNLGCTPGTIDATRGLVFGCTTWDMQKSGSMGRQISTDQVFHIINAVWTNKIGGFSVSDGATVRYDSWDPAFGQFGDGAGGTELGCTGFPPCWLISPTLEALSDGTNVVTFQENSTFNIGIQRNRIYKNATPGLGDFGGDILPDSVWSSYAIGPIGDPTSGEFAWPQIAYTDDGATQVTHLLVSRDIYDGSIPNLATDTLHQILYTRRIGSSGDAWSLGMALGESRQSRSAVIAASPNSSRVGISWIGPRGDGSATGAPIPRYSVELSSEFDNDVYVMISDDAGATWNSRVNVTLRADSLPGGWAPHAKMTSLFDMADNFHIVWQAMAWQGYGVAPNKRARLFHWDPLSGIIRTVFDANWDPEFCSSGFHQLNIDNPQISVCDNKLYVTFSYFAPVPEGRSDDCAEEAFDPLPRFEGSASADIWMAVSDNDGFNWDPPRNLTNSYTPMCDTIPGGAFPDCDSDVWHSATRYGVDITGNNFSSIPDLSSNIGGYAGSNYLFVSYINDAHPGAAVLGEGGWTDNPVRVFRFGCVEKVGGCPLASSLPQGQAIGDPAHVLPGSDSTIGWRIENLCNFDISYSISVTNDIPPGNVTVTGGSGLLSSGIDNSDDLTLTLNANKETTPQSAHAEISISGNFTGSPKIYIIDYCICDLQLLQHDSLDSDLVFMNNGNIGRQNNGGQGKLNLDFEGDPAECDTTGNAKSYIFDGSPIISYPGDGGNLVVSSMFSFSIVDSFQFRPLETPSTSEDADWYMGHSGEFTTQDSTIGLIADYWKPKSGVPSGWNVVYARVGYYSIDGVTSLSNLTAAYGWDWDVPSDSGSRNTSGIDGTNGFVYLQGAEFGDDTGNTACLDNDRRFAAAGYYPGSAIVGMDDWSPGGSGAMNLLFKSQYTRDNATFVGGNWDHSKLDSMLINIAGFNTYATSASDSLEGVDLHMVLNGGTYNIDPDDTLYLHMMFLTGIASDNTTAELSSVWEALYQDDPWGLPTCCDTPGDFNNDSSFNIADITSVISFIFSGGAGPVCCNEGDINGDCTINIADATCGIAHIFGTGFCQPTCCPDKNMTCSPQ